MVQSESLERPAKSARSRSIRRRRGERVDPRVYMVRNARARARRRGVPFALTPDDIHIPARCPWLNKPMHHAHFGVQGPRRWSPTIDCIIPELGYVPGNVMVVSCRANVLKGRSTLDTFVRRLVQARALEVR